jgi:DDE superfamily endonuclease
MQAILVWSLWQELVLRVAAGLTAPGQRRFVEWITGLALNDEEHTITQSLLALDRPQDWKALEAFAETGAWDQAFLAWTTTRLVETVPNPCWFGYHVWAGDDTKVHRSSQDVWGTCTFHEYTARCPNRAATVRAHNWVVLGALQRRDDEPAWFLPIDGRLYFRKTQLPAGEVFRTKNDLLVELLRQQATRHAGPHLAVFDGAFAVANVVRPLLGPGTPEHPRIEFVTRLRPDSRLCAVPAEPKAKQRGPHRKWGPPLAPPRQGGRWPGPWQERRAYLYGRWRQVRYKEVLCQWRVLGHDVPVKVVVAKVEGYRKRFTLVSSATALSGLQIVELFCARFRQEDGFRDLKQRLGWEECRAWTKAPIERTTQALFVTLTLLRLLPQRLLDQTGQAGFAAPPWNPGKARPSVLDGQRLLRRHRAEILQGLSDWLAEGGKKAG